MNKLCFTVHFSFRLTACGKIVQKYARKQHAEVLHTCKKITLYMTLFDLTSNLEIQEKLVLFL